MGAHAAVVYVNLKQKPEEVKLFNKLPEIFSCDILDFFLKKESSDVSPLWELMNGLDPDIKFISENVSTMFYFQ